MILDTNALSALADRSDALDGIPERIDVLAIPVVVLGEYRFGIAGSRHAARYEAWLERVVHVSRILDLDDGTTHHYAGIRRELKQKGQPIPSNDTWIAALARQHRLPVISRDRHFDQVKGIHRIAW